MAESDVDLQHMLNILNLTLAKLRLKINLSKTFIKVWIKDKKKKKMIFDNSSNIKVNYKVNYKYYN